MSDVGYTAREIITYRCNTHGSTSDGLANVTSKLVSDLKAVLSTVSESTRNT